MERMTVASPWLSPVEAAAYIHRRRDRVDQLVKSGVITAYRDPEGRGVLINASDLDEYVRTWPTAAKGPLSRSGSG